MNETDAIREEAAKLKAQGVDIIIALTHCGLDEDYKIARNLGSSIDVIVGGHSHSFMYTQTGDKPSPGPDTPRGRYPEIIETGNGHKTIIVQASEHVKYVGNIVIFFDEAGNVVDWDGAPVFLDTNVVKDPVVVRELEPWRKIIDAQARTVIGRSRVAMNRTNCFFGECNLGNIFTDSFVHYYTANLTADAGEWTQASIGLMNAAGLRTSLPNGSKRITTPN